MSEQTGTSHFFPDNIYNTENGDIYVNLSANILQDNQFPKDINGIFKPHIPLNLDIIDYKNYYKFDIFNDIISGAANNASITTQFIENKTNETESSGKQYTEKIIDYSSNISTIIPDTKLFSDFLYEYISGNPGTLTKINNTLIEINSQYNNHANSIALSSINTDSTLTELLNIVTGTLTPNLNRAQLKLYDHQLLFNDDLYVKSDI